MKPGYFISIGLITWLLLSFMDSLWVVQSKGHLGAACAVGLGCIIWLTSAENRERFKAAFSARRFAGNFLERLLNSIQIGVIAIFSLAVIAIESSKYFVRQSEGYNYMVSELTKNKTIHDRVGQIEYITIGNSLGSGLSFKDSAKRMSANLKVFGTLGRVNVNIEVTKNVTWRIEDLKITD